MAKWECTICGHIYDEEKGDPDSGIAPEECLNKLIEMLDGPGVFINEKPN